MLDWPYWITIAIAAFGIGYIMGEWKGIRDTEAAWDREINRMPVDYRRRS